MEIDFQPNVTKVLEASGWNGLCEGEKMADASSRSIVKIGLEVEDVLTVEQRMHFLISGFAISIRWSNSIVGMLTYNLRFTFASLSRFVQV